MNILFTGAFEPSAEEKALIEQAGHKVFFHRDERVMPESPSLYQAAVCNNLFLFNSIEPFVNLRRVQLTSAGLDRIPAGQIRKRGIELFSACGVYSKPMAEFAVSAVLDFYKQSRFFAENQKRRKWEKHRTLTELFQKKVCILGCGDVGKETAKLFKAFGCHITGVNRTERTLENFDEILPLEKLSSAASDCDILISCIALTEQTQKLINKSVFDALKSNAVFVNISRGAVADEFALVEWLLHGGRAALDVFENEPLDEDSPLWCMKNVILTPHNSFIGENNHRRMFDLIVKNLECVGNGKL